MVLSDLGGRVSRLKITLWQGLALHSFQITLVMYLHASNCLRYNTCCLLKHAVLKLMLVINRLKLQLLNLHKRPI